MFVFTADTHLQWSTWAGHPAINQDAYCAFSCITSYCEEHELPLLLGGDILDSKRPDPRTVAYLYRECDRMEAAGCPMLFIQGQHELSRESPWLKCHPWPTHLDQQLYTIDGCTIYGLDWRPAAVIPQALEEVPDVADILLAHQVWEDFLPLKAECRFSQVPTPYLLTGDFHQTIELDAVNSRDDTMRVISPGSTCLQRVNEPPDKYFFVATLGPEGDLDWRAVPIPSRPFYEWTAETSQDLEGVVQAISAVHEEIPSDLPEPIRAPICRVRYAADIPEAYDRLRQAIEQSSVMIHLFPEPQQRTEDIEVDVEDVQVFQNWQSALSQFSASERATTGLTRLMSCEDDGDRLQQLEALHHELFTEGGPAE